MKTVIKPMRILVPAALYNTTILAGGALFGAVLLADPALAQELRGKVLDDGSAIGLPVGANTERETVADEGSIPFAISVDGETVEKSVDPSDAAAADLQDKPVDRQRRTDVGLEGVDIQIKFDGLSSERRLNVSTATTRRSYRAGETVGFLATSNYAPFIARSEILIYRADDGRARKRPLGVVPVSINGEAGWVMPPEATPGETGEFSYVLRVYDARGRYDETAPLPLSRSDRDFAAELTEEPVAPGMGEDNTAIRNIPATGGVVTVYGRNVPPGHTVEAFGETIPVDADRSFVTQRLLPPGEHSVDVAVNDAASDGGLHFSRDINIPDNEWFYVALGDLTVGKNSGDAGIETVRPGEYDEVWSRGRMAFYLKGKIKGEYLLTAAADTGEEDVEDMFRDLDGKDPRRLLRRLDPDDYYPVYGDDSTFVEDAPTDGKFYVRLERGDSYVMWGNYNTAITGTEFLRAERGLYGASAAYRSEAATSFGERRTEVTLYAAQPDTLPQVDEFLGTGGSAYFLKRQDIVEGSETVAVEVRDEVTGRLIERRLLNYGEDYSFDYLQGVIILKRPLSSTTGTRGPVRDGALGGNKLVLTVQYEYEPVASDVDGYAYGGRAQHWLNDHVRVGVTGMDESTDIADQRAYGADIKLRHSQTTFLEAEIARSKGPGFGRSLSTDGGLTLSDSASTGKDDAANAWRVEGQVDLEDLSADGVTGIVGGYYEEKEAGFSTLYDQVAVDRRIWGAFADVDLDERWNLRLTYDDYNDDDGQIDREGTTSVSWQIDEYWKVSFGVSYKELMSPLATASGKSGYDGSRLDAGVRVDYQMDEDRLFYVFGQATLDRSGDIDRNDRGGVGAEYKLTDTIGLSGEVSYGTHGWGGLAAVNYDPNEDEHYYLGYRLDPDRAYDLDNDYDLYGSDRGEFVIGMRRRIDEVAAAYAENSYDMFGERTSLTQTYGVVYTPDDVWTVDVGFEGGRIRDATIDPDTGLQREDFDRYAPSLAIGYKDEEAGIAARVRGEVRIEDSDDGTRDQTSYLFTAGLGWETSEDWRLIAHIDTVISDTDASVVSYQDTDYVEASVGYAYRPVNHDRLNALFKYTWLYDLPGTNQVMSASTGDIYAPAQRSHILSADVMYDLVPWLSVGGKYGFRYGEVKYRIDDDTAFQDEWQRSSAHLGIIRADLHIVKKWDLLLEGRVMHMPEADTTDFGALAALYRHVGNNFKVGVGYNFGSFSDDLRDLTLNDEGAFFNVVAKF